MRRWWPLLVGIGCGGAPADPGPDGPGGPTGPPGPPTASTESGTSTGSTSGTPPVTSTGGASSPDTRREGPFAVEVGEGQLGSGPGCTVRYDTFQPVGAPATDQVVVLTHGFSRDRAQMADLAAHLASWGVPVVAPSVCHSTPLDNDPDQDAADLVAVADALGAAGRLYVGHSAGGLRSVLAAAADPDAVAVLGLDLVDLGTTAADAAATLPIPVYGLLGEPYSCNSDGNGLPVYQAAADGLALGIVDADHCDFESPTNWLCTTFCDLAGQTFDPAEVQSTLFGLATAFVLWRTGADPAGATWWSSPGEAYDELVATGAVLPLAP